MPSSTPTPEMIQLLQQAHDNVCLILRDFDDEYSQERFDCQLGGVALEMYGILKKWRENA